MSKTLAVVSVVEALALAALVAVALDMRAHYRVQDLGGVNVWGYRGPVMRVKRANETRVALVGGDLAFGWGVAASETLPYSVRQLVALNLDRRGQLARRVTAVNVGARGLALRDYAGWIEHFAYLRPDVICIVSDPSGHRLSADRFLPDRRSRFFAAFAYSPILPLVLQEKGAMTHSAVLQAAGALLARADAALQPAAATPPPTNIGSIEPAIRAALRIAPAGVVVVKPPDGDGEDMTEAAADPRVRVVTLGGSEHEEPDGLRLDGFHFSAGGHAWAAEAVAPAVLELVHAADRVSR